MQHSPTWSVGGQGLRRIQFCRLEPRTPLAKESNLGRGDCTVATTSCHECKFESELCRSDYMHEVSDTLRQYLELGAAEVKPWYEHSVLLAFVLVHLAYTCR
jgi:hypothetical protein